MSSGKQRQYDEQLVIRYLLGSVPEAEAERLDELSVSDEEFANRLAAVENDLVDAYVRGELTAETRDRFQSYYLSSLRRREKVNFAESLLALPVSEAGPPNVLAPARMPRKSLVFAVAACLALLTACLFLYQNSQLRTQLIRSQQRTAALEQKELEARQQIDQLAQAANTAGGLAIVLSPQLRGAGPLAAIAIHAGSVQADFQLELEPGDFAEYHASLRAQGESQVIWQSGTLRAASRGGVRFVALSLPAGVLRPRNYTLELSGVTANGSPELLSSYSFTVVP